MAILFTSGSSQYGSLTLPASYAFPLTIAIRVNLTSTASTVVFLNVGTSTTLRFHLGLISAKFFVGDIVGQTLSSAGPSTGVWHTVAGVFEAGQRNLYVDGVYQSQAASTSGNCNELIVGRSNSGSSYANAHLQDAACWSRALSVSEMLAFHRGAAPILMPYLLRAYVPLAGNTSPEPNYCGNALSLFNGPPKSTHTRVVYPA